MADNKQPPLNDAFYGPSIPPSTRRHARHNHHHNRSCLCTLFCFLIKIILALVLLTGLAILIFWLIFRPTSNLKFHVSNASLTEFTLLNNTLHYNLIVNLTAHNPNTRIGVHYKSLKAQAYYENQRFGHVSLNVLDQGYNDTSVWRLVFNGQSYHALGESDDDEKLAGVFSIEVRASLRYRLRFGKLTTSTMHPKITCEMEVPLNNGNGFRKTKCKLRM